MNFRLRVTGMALVALAGTITIEARSPSQVVALVPAGDYKPVFKAAGTPAAILVPAFYLDVRPVTNAEFLAFVRVHQSWRRSRVPVVLADTGYLEAWSGDLELGPRAPADAPVVNVSWFAAQAYARSQGRRLPTTAEWERAAQAGFTVENGRSDTAYRVMALAWFSRPATTILPPAGSGRPNYYGISDLIDLVWEWTDDFNVGLMAGASNDAVGSDTRLFCGSAAVNAREFGDYPAFLRAEFRSSLHASFVMPDLGFRCATSK